MANKPITVARQEYMQKIVDVTNSAELPAFVKLDVIRQIFDKLKTLTAEELKRDTEDYNASLREEEQPETAQPDEVPFTGVVKMGGATTDAHGGVNHENQ